MIDHRNKIAETRDLSIFLEGYSLAFLSENPDLAKNLRLTASWLKKISQNMCGKGYIGCNGGENCESSHK